jgi:hypothetical protein
MRRRILTVPAVLILVWAGTALVRRQAYAVALPAEPGQQTAAKGSSSETLDRLLAPIALYPDQLLGQILLCAGNPGRVAALGDWLAANGSLKGSALQDAALKSGFDASYVALVLFPDVVNRMAAETEWTAQVGQAFESDRSGVFASIQRLRARARDAGKLKTTPQQEVETRTTPGGEQVIVIEPANPQVVYVPQYNAQTVYTAPASTTVVVQDDDDADAAVAAGLIGFTAGIALGAAIDNDYYYGPYGYRGGFYMYDDAWDDWYDEREDMREDWQDHREDLVEDRGERREDLAEERGDRARTAQEGRTDRQQTRQENRPETQAAREQRRTDAQGAASQARSASGTSQEARGRTQSAERPSPERHGTRSDAFSGYSSGRSERAASSRGQRSRSSSRSGGRRR